MSEEVTPTLTGDPGPAEAAEPTQTQEAPAFDGPEFLKDVDPELLGQANLKSFQDMNSLVKSYVHAQKMIGKDKIVLPDEHATDEDWRAIYEKLGLPEKDKYELDFGETKYDDEFKQGFLEKAHQAGILPRQAKEMFEFFNNQVETSTERFSQEQQVKQQEAVEGLKTEWGAGFDKELKIAQTALRQFADEDTIQYLDDTGLGNDPNLIKLFNKIGKGLSEDTFDRKAVGSFGLTKDEAQDKMNSIYGNMDHPYWNSEHPSHGSAVQEMLKYQEILAS